MNRRSFLQLLSLSPVAPVLLCAKEKVLLESGLWMTREDYEHAGEPYWKKQYNLRAAHRMAFPAMIIHEDGSIEPIKAEEFFIDI